ncbi:hypothetical protein AgCh_018718 [Apium graveolens]
MPMSPPVSNEMVMQMSFYWGKDVIILFQGWPSNNLAMYILALAFVFMLSAATEVLSIPHVIKSSGSRPMIEMLIQATVYAVKMGLAYLVMLSVMSYNLGIFIVAVTGHGLGFLLVKIRALAAAAAANQGGSEFVDPKV